MAKRGRKPKYQLQDEACPNPECGMYGKPGAGNIVSNDTYRTSGGDKPRRFLCRACGKSFCSRGGTIFYDLRSPEERVMMALKLSCKGDAFKGSR